MSTYKKKYDTYEKIKIGKTELEWFEVWDSLYYNFINDNKKYLESNYSSANIVRIWNNKEIKEKEKLLEISKNYLLEY